jgi:hypothetical protein
MSADPDAGFHPDNAALFVDPAVGRRKIPAPLRSPLLHAAVSLKIQDYDITGIDVQSRFAGAFWIDVGKNSVFWPSPSQTPPTWPCQRWAVPSRRRRGGEGRGHVHHHSRQRRGRAHRQGCRHLSIVRAS